MTVGPSVAEKIPMLHSERSKSAIKVYIDRGRPAEKFTILRRHRSNPAHETIPAPVRVERPVFRWYHKISAVLFITFCLEIGLFLLIFPWTEFWETNYFAAYIPEWHQYWGNMYVRGAISGIGVVNLYISFGEMFRLRRFSKR